MDVFAFHRRLRRPGGGDQRPAVRRVSPGRHLRTSRHEGHGVFRAAGQGRSPVRQLSPRADKSLRLLDAPETSEYLREPSFFSGGGGLTSTMQDYLRFCEMLRRGGELEGARILGPRTVALMRRNHLKDGKDLAEMAVGAFSETANEGVGFGLGFATTLDEAAGGLGGGDYYWGGAASTLFAVDPVEDLT